MSCYLRHVKEIVAEAGIEITPANKKAIDRAFHAAVGVAYKDCPATWKKLKPGLAGDPVKRQAILEAFQKAMSQG